MGGDAFEAAHIAGHHGVRAGKVGEHDTEVCVGHGDAEPGVQGGGQVGTGGVEKVISDAQSVDRSGVGVPAVPPGLACRRSRFVRRAGPSVERNPEGFLVLLSVLGALAPSLI